MGDIVQDADGSVDDEERERRFNRYVELVHSVTGSEPDEVFHCLIAAVRDQDDYGAHEAVLGALLRFDPHRLGRLTAMALPGAISRVPDFAGNLLGQLAFGSYEVVAAFNDGVATLPASQRGAVAAFVAAEEQEDGWLSSSRQRGRIQVA